MSSAQFPFVSVQSFIPQQASPSIAYVMLRFLHHHPPTPVSLAHQKQLNGTEGKLSGERNTLQQSFSSLSTTLSYSISLCFTDGRA